MKLIKFLVILGMILFFCFFPSVNFLGWILLFIILNLCIKDILSGWKKETEEREEKENRELEEIERKCEIERQLLKKWEAEQE